MVLDVYFFPFPIPFLIHAAMLAGMQIRSTAVPFDQMLGRQQQSWWYGCLGGQLPLARGKKVEQTLRREEPGHCRASVGLGIQSGPQRDGVRERKEGFSTRQATQRGRSKNRLGEQPVSVFIIAIMSAVGSLVMLTQCSSMQMFELIQTLVKLVS